MENIKERINNIILRQRKKIEKEIEIYEEKLHETLSYYGVGGPYRRQEAAIEKRQEQLEELDDFKEQLNRAKKHQNVRMYVFACRECGGITLVSKKPFTEWHECPVCRTMIYLSDLPNKSFQIVDSGEAWIESLERITEED